MQPSRTPEDANVIAGGVACPTGDPNAARGESNAIREREPKMTQRDAPRTPRWNIPPEHVAADRILEEGAGAVAEA